MRCEPDAAALASMTNQLFQYPDARAIADDVRMHGELEQSAFVVRGIELAAKNLEHCCGRRIGPKRLAAVHPEIHGIIAYPLDRQFYDAAWLAIEQQLIAILVSHQ